MTDYWKQREVTERLIAKRNARKPQMVSPSTHPHLFPKPAQWAVVRDNTLEWMDKPPKSIISHTQ